MISKPDRCFLGLKGCMGRPLHRHHLIGGANRQKSEKYDLTVMLCPYCHQYVHEHNEYNLRLKKVAEIHCLIVFGWTVDKFIEEFSWNYLDDNELEYLRGIKNE